MKNVDEFIKSYIDIYRSVSKNNSSVTYIEKLKNKLDIVNKKKDKLLKYNVSGKLSDKDFLNIDYKLSKEVEDLKLQITDAAEQLSGKEKLEKHICQIKNVLK